MTLHSNWALGRTHFQLRETRGTDAFGIGNPYHQSVSWLVAITTPLPKSTKSTTAMIVTQGEHQYSLVAHSEWLQHNTYFIMYRSHVDIFSAIWPVTKLAMALHWESLRQNNRHKSIHGCLASSYHPSNPSTSQPIPRTFRRTHSPNSRDFPRILLFLWLLKRIPSENSPKMIFTQKQSLGARLPTWT